MCFGTSASESHPKPCVFEGRNDSEMLNFDSVFKCEPLCIKGITFHMGQLLVELADEIPPVVVDPRRPQAIFLMQENYFGSVMFGALTPREAIDQYKEAMKQSWSRN